MQGRSSLQVLEFGFQFVAHGFIEGFFLLDKFLSFAFAVVYQITVAKGQTFFSSLSFISMILMLKTGSELRNEHICIIQHEKVMFRVQKVFFQSNALNHQFKSYFCLCLYFFFCNTYECFSTTSEFSMSLDLQPTLFMIHSLTCLQRLLSMKFGIKFKSYHLDKLADIGNMKMEKIIMVLLSYCCAEKEIVYKSLFYFILNSSRALQCPSFF